MNFTLLKALAVTDFKLRYKNSVLGYLWSLLKPMTMFGVLYLVFSFFMRFAIEYYPLYLLLGILLWNYFQEASVNGMNSLLNKSSLLKKLNVNKFIVVLASNVTTLMTLLLNLLIFFGFLIVFKPSLNWGFLILFITISELFLVGLGASLALSVSYVKLRDLSNVWEIVIQLGFWLTPIIYPLDVIPGRFHAFFAINPLHRILREARDAIIYQKMPHLGDGLVTLLMAIFIFALGYLIFKRRSYLIAEEL